MKATKITVANIPAITAALIAANGEAKNHTYSADQIINVAETAEAKVIALLGNKKDVVGATVSARSGGKLPNAYKYDRLVNQITIERRSSGWWLVYIGCYKTFEKSGATSKLTLTSAQDVKAVARFHRYYQVK